MNSQHDPYPNPGGRDVPAPVSGTRLPSTDLRESIQDFEDAADLRDYLEVVLRRKWLVLTFLVGVFITTLVVSLTMKPVFRATGRLELSLQTPKVTKFEDVVASQLQTREFIQTQVKLLQSETLARRVIEKLRLDRNPTFNPAADPKNAGKESILSQIKESVTELFFLGGDRDGKKGDPALKRLELQKSIELVFSKSLEVQPERDTTIISLAFRCTDAALARDIINALIQEFIAWQMDKRIDAASSAKQQLEKQLEVARIQLEKAEINLNTFASKAGIVSLRPNLNITYKELEAVNAALATAIGERLGKQALYKQAQLGDLSTITMVQQSPLIQQLRAQYVAAMAEYEQFAATFKDEYPKLKMLKAKMVDIEKQIKNEEKNVLESIKYDYMTALEKEESLRSEAEEKKTLALELNSRAIQYRILDREVETSKAIHSSLLERAKEIDANVGTGLGNIQVVDYATLPLKPYRPNVQLNLLLAVVVGLMGGVGLAFFLEYLDNTVKRIDEISDRFRIPVLGVLPLASTEEVRELDSIVRTQPKSSFSESIRTAKVSIQLSSSMDQPAKSFVITSTTAGEGKSTISANLAQAFATSDEKVVIIDADLRKPRLHKAFNTNGHRKGLSHYLSGMCTIEEVIQETEVPSLCFIAAGPVPPNPAELLASTRMKNFLEMLGERFDRIIIDGPPAAGFADVLVLSSYVNGVILVNTLGQTHREALRIFRRSIFNVRGHILGSIVNKLNVSHHYGGYYYKYYKYYHYYYHSAYGDRKPSLPEESKEE